MVPSNTYDEDIHSFVIEILLHFEKKHMKAARDDEFLNKMANKGIYKEKLLKGSLIMKFGATIESVVTERNLH